MHSNILHEGKQISELWNEFLDGKNELIEKTIRQARVKLPLSKIDKFVNFIEGAELISCHYRSETYEMKNTYIFFVNGEIYVIKDNSDFTKRTIVSPFGENIVFPNFKESSHPLNDCLAILFDLFKLDVSASLKI